MKVKDEHDREQVNLPPRRAKTARSAAPFPTREKRTSLFVLSCGRNLRLGSNLLETLGIDKEAALRSQRKKKVDFMREAQQAWEQVWKEIDKGSRDFFKWYRGLLREANGIGVWIPAVFLLRLRQLERQELKIERRNGELIHRSASDALPDEFVECCSCMGWSFQSIVPSLREGEFEDCREHGRSHTNFVCAVVDAWKHRPQADGVKAIQDFVVEKLAEQGWTIS